MTPHFTYLGRKHQSWGRHRQMWETLKHDASCEFRDINEASKEVLPLEKDFRQFSSWRIDHARICYIHINTWIWPLAQVGVLPGPPRHGLKFGSSEGKQHGKWIKRRWKTFVVCTGTKFNYLINLCNQMRYV